MKSPYQILNAKLEKEIQNLQKEFFNFLIQNKDLIKSLIKGLASALIFVGKTIWNIIEVFLSLYHMFGKIKKAMSDNSKNFILFRTIVYAAITALIILFQGPLIAAFSSVIASATAMWASITWPAVLAIAAIVAVLS